MTLSATSSASPLTSMAAPPTLLTVNTHHDFNHYKWIFRLLDWSPYNKFYKSTGLFTTGYNFSTCSFNSNCPYSSVLEWRCTSNSCTSMHTAEWKFTNVEWVFHQPDRIKRRSSLLQSKSCLTLKSEKVGYIILKLNNFFNNPPSLWQIVIPIP